MKVKVLHYLNGSDEPSEYGKIMDAFVFKENANIERIADYVQKVWEENEGQKSYYDIIIENFGDKLLEVIESKEVVW